jgi:hypothetical protein
MLHIARPACERCARVRQNGKDVVTLVMESTLYV